MVTSGPCQWSWPWPPGSPTGGRWTDTWTCLRRSWPSTPSPTATIKRIHKLAHGLELIPDRHDPTIRPIVYDVYDEDDPEGTIMGKVVYAVMSLDYSI